jgi:hypothetical protein
VDGHVTPMPEEPEEIINHGEDRATLDLVAKLSGSPVRSLRKRPPSSSAPNSEENKRTRTRQRSRSGILDTPRRSNRGGGGAVAESPLRAVNVRGNGGVLGLGDGDGDGEEDGEWEAEDEDLDMDAEGEEYLEE